MKRGTKGVYCLETGEWFPPLKKKNSVEPVLQLLRDSPQEVPYIHRDVSTEEELRYYLRKWIQARHKDYPILYLAFHGSPGCIHIWKENGRSATVGMEDIFDLLCGRCHRRVIHFGACSVLDIHGHTVNRYKRDSGAAAISGYASDVDWVISSMFDLLYLSELQKNQFTKKGLAAVWRRMNKMALRLSRELEFRMRLK